MKKLFVLFTLLVIACVWVNAYAERNNLQINGELRTRMFVVDDKDFDSDLDDEYTFYDSRVQIDIIGEMTDGVSAVVTAEGSGFFGDYEEAFSSDVSSGDGDISQGYIEFADMKNTPWSLKLGRQFMNYGDGFLVSNNEREISYDAATLVADYAPWTLSLAAVDMIETFEADNDIHMYLVDVDYTEGDIPFEFGGYAIFVDDNSVADNSPTSVGVRCSYMATEALDFWGELTYQTGDSGELDKEAWGIDLGAVYSLDTSWTPQFKLNYLLATGDGEVDGDDEAFDALGQYRYYGYALSPEFSNIQIVNAAVEVTPSEFWMLALNYFNFTQDEEAAAAIGNANLTDPGISVLTNGTDDDLGDEIDLSVQHVYTGDVTAMVTLAYFMPGDAYDSDDEALEVRGELLVSF